MKMNLENQKIWSLMLMILKACYDLRMPWRLAGVDVLNHQVVQLLPMLQEE